MTKSRSPHVGSVHKDSPRRMPQVRGGCYLAIASSRVLRGEPHAHRPFHAELWTVKGSATVIAVGVGRHGVGRDNNLHNRRPVCASQGQPTPGIPLVVTSHRLGHLTFTPPAVIIVVANVSFRSRLTGRGPEGTVCRNPTLGVT
jgi:hypothetical protein